MLMKGAKEEEYEEMNITNRVKTSIEAKLEEVEKSLEDFLELNTDLVTSEIKQEGNKIVFEIGERKNKEESDRIKEKINEFYNVIKTDCEINSSKIKTI